MQVARWFLFIAAFLAQFIATTLAATVGVLGEPNRLAITGAETFSPDEIKRALSLNADYQSAADPDASLDDYLETVKELIRAGYGQAGFPDADVSVSFNADSNAVAVTVKEGPRYLAGKIRVVGSNTLPIDELTARLTEKHPPKDSVARSFSKCEGKVVVNWTDLDEKDVKLLDPVWCMGKPANFPITQESHSDLDRDVADAFADLGYLFARFSVEVVPDRATGKADLVIDVADEGPRTLIGSANVIGNSINSREELLQYVAFEPGTPATQAELVRLQSKLWHSGRFIKSKVTMIRPATADDPAALQIEVLELDRATPLSKPLSREEEICLKCCEQFADPDCWDGDIVISDGDEKSAATVVFSPTKGAFMDWSHRPSLSETSAEHAILLSPDECGLYSLSTKKKLVTNSVRKQLVGHLAIHLADNANDAEEGRGRFEFGCHTTHDRVSQTPFSLALTFEPAFFVDLPHRPETKFTVQDGVMTISTPWAITRIDVASSKLIEVVLSNLSEESNKETPQEHPPTDQIVPDSTCRAGQSDKVIRISFVPGEFRRRTNALQQTAADISNAYEERRPVSSLLRFVCDEDAVRSWLGIENQRFWQVAKWMLDKGVCEAFDRAVAKYIADSTSGDEDDAFRTPEPVVVSQPVDRNLAFCTACLATVADQSSPPGTWPMAIRQQAYAMLVGHGDAAARQIKRTCESDQNGPLCFLVSSAIFEYLNPVIARQMTARGLERLSVEDFRKEYPVLLDAEYPIGECLHRMAALLRESDDRQLDALCALLSAESAGAIRQWVIELRQNPDRSTDQAVPALLDALWQSGLREHVKTAMETVQGYCKYFVMHNNPDKTIADATQAISINPDDSDAYQAQAYVYMLKGEYDGAIADFTEALRIDPSNGWVYYGLGRAHSESRHFERAVADYTEAIRLDPENAPKYGYGARAWAYAQKCDYDEAIADYTEAIRLDPENALRYYRERASVYMQKCDRNNVIADCTDALRLDSNNGWTFHMRGTAYMSNADPDKALADFTDAIRVDPDTTPKYLAMRAWAYKQKGDYDKAIADLTELIQRCPKDANAYACRAYMHQWKGDQCRPTSVSPWPRGDLTFSTTLDYDKTAGDATESNSTDSEGPIASAMLRDSYYDKAIADYTEAIRLNPDLADAYNARSLLYIAKGDTVHAEADIAEAKRLETTRR